MKLINHKHKAYPSLLVGCLMLASASALALTSNDNQLIKIAAMQQAVDMATNTVTLTGKVVVKRGALDIRADKVVITRPDNMNVVIEGYGSPVTFYQWHNDGQQVSGYAQNVRYETAHDRVIFTGNAYLEQLESNVKFDRMIYLVKRQQLETFSDKGKQVTTVIVPSYWYGSSITAAVLTQ
nr:lipopolysaccharide transport periplasmic protein LptA [Candidatus Moranella endobia]